MRISSSRLEASLKANGFQMCQTGGFAVSFGFVRPDPIPDLYQQIDVCFAGRGSDTVFAYIASSVTKWIKIKGLSESRLLDEIAQNQERGWAVIANDAQAKDWEESLIRVGPTKAAEFAVQMREMLLTRTAKVRQFARTHLDRLDQNQSIANQIDDFRNKLPSKLFSEAVRLASSPGVVQLRGAVDVYKLSCLVILSADKGPEFAGQDPLMNDDLVWQIQLVADGILSWDANGLF